MRLLPTLVAIFLLIAFTTAIPVGYHDAHQEFIKAVYPSKQYLTNLKRGLAEIFSPILDAHSPDCSISTSGKTIPKTHIPPHLEYLCGPWAMPKAPPRLPWMSSPLPSPKPCLPMLEPVCARDGPYCPPRPLTPIAEDIKESIVKLIVAPKPVEPEPVVVSSSVMSASELARNIVEQISVECPNCGYGTAGGVKSSNWLRFVEWVKKVWQLMRGKSVHP